MKLIKRLLKNLKPIKSRQSQLSLTLANQLMEDKWWCPNCNKWISPRDVTFEEIHDVKSGGCGYAVE